MINLLVTVFSGFPDRSSPATDFPGSWYPYEVLKGFDEVEDDTTEGILAVKFIIGLDLAVTRSSPDSCWSLFAIAAEQTVELKWLMLNKHNKWFHSSRVKFPSVKKKCELVFGVDVFDVDFGVQINSIEQPIKSNSVGSGDVSHCRTSAFK